MTFSEKQPRTNHKSEINKNPKDAKKSPDINTQVEQEGLAGQGKNSLKEHLKKILKEIE